MTITQKATFNQTIFLLLTIRSYRGHDRLVVGFTTTYAIGTYLHWCFELEYQSGRGVQHYVIKFVSDLRQVGGFFPGPPVSSTNKTDRHEILLKVGLNTIKQTNNKQYNKTGYKTKSIFFYTFYSRTFNRQAGQSHQTQAYLFSAFETCKF